MMSDIYFEMGLVNMSQRCAFEAMEAGWNSRSLCRLAETAIVTGQYDVALKYIWMLERIVGYKKTGKKLRFLAEHPEQISNHPNYGNLRRMHASAPEQFFL